ncbi:MAG: carboxymuconolactone decarboxylase family protein, partial [Bacteroidetes bacterium]|nr:carboxymuconolactone decarboxylase family protein [Bacteroidota bacterium]
VFYRFRHFVDKEVYNNSPARLRMNIMMSPVLGKEFFELVSLAVSAINGCEMCVKSHEQSVLANGGTEQRIWDSIRIASIITSLGKVVY